MHEPIHEQPNIYQPYELAFNMPQSSHVQILEPRIAGRYTARMHSAQPPNSLACINKYHWLPRATDRDAVTEGAATFGSWT